MPVRRPARRQTYPRRRLP